MTNYECCYTSGKQFVFAERRTWIVGCFLAVAFVSWIGGLLIGMGVSFGGVLSFDTVWWSSAAFAAIRGYYVGFKRTHSSVDVVGYFSVVSLLFCAIAFFWLAVRYTLLLDLKQYEFCALLSVFCLMFGVVTYVFVVACCQEDERKHHLIACTAQGETLVAARPEVAEGGSSTDATFSDPWIFIRALSRYVALFYSIFYSSYCQHTVPGDEDYVLDDRIIVHNRTLKLIKVCLYASDDILCWIPHGGISGRGVGFVHAEEFHSFSFSRSLLVNGGFTLKVFQPSLFDKELACIKGTQLGQSFAFHDVEGMMKRSRLLSATPDRLPARLSNMGCVESSESEFEDSKMKSAAAKSSELLSSMSSNRNPSNPSASSGSLRRVRSRLEVNLLAHLQDSAPNTVTAPSAGSTASPTESRRAAPHEVVVRNRSNQEIRALLFRSTDFSFLVPLIGKLTSCGDMILPDNERRFNPSAADHEFTVKVYSVGPGAKELTYLTVQRGQVYTFCDSLLS